MNKFDEIKNIINKAGVNVQFSKFGEGISHEWIEKAEARLGFPLPCSYKWWLQNYGGGEIYGEEIFSVYGLDFDDVIGGDIVYLHELNKKRHMYDNYMLAICMTDEEIFCFNTLYKNTDNEYPIYELNQNKLYAIDFIEFLKKRIME